MKYISKVKHGYILRKQVNGEMYHFGYYQSIEEAKKAREYFITHEWDINERFKFMEEKEYDEEMKYISKARKGYRVSKYINGKGYHFGHYPTLEKAKEARNYFIEHDWDINERLKFKDTNMMYIRKTKQGYYKIEKRLNNTTEYFGTFHSLEDAISERDLLIKYNWDLELVCEDFDCTREQWLKDKSCSRNLYQKVNRGQSDFHMALNGRFLKTCME